MGEALRTCCRKFHLDQVVRVGHLDNGLDLCIVHHHYQVDLAGLADRVGL